MSTKRAKLSKAEVSLLSIDKNIEKSFEKNLFYAVNIVKCHRI